MADLYIHPFKRAIRGILGQHFAPSIADRFILIFEAELYNKESVHIWRQLKNNQLIMEVRYEMPGGFSVYICDLMPYWSKPQCEAHLLRYITDKVKSKQIGKDWTEKGGLISQDIKSGKHVTPQQPDEVANGSGSNS